MGMPVGGSARASSGGPAGGGVALGAARAGFLAPVDVSATMSSVPQLPEQLDCARCARTGSAAELATGWSVSVPPRPTGSTQPRAESGEEIRMLCPDCARHAVRDLEARLDP